MCLKTKIKENKWPGPLVLSIIKSQLPHPHQLHHHQNQRHVRHHLFCFDFWFCKYDFKSHFHFLWALRTSFYLSITYNLMLFCSRNPSFGIILAKLQVTVFLSSGFWKKLYPFSCKVRIQHQHEKPLYYSSSIVNKRHWLRCFNQICKSSKI